MDFTKEELDEICNGLFYWWAQLTKWKLETDNIEAKENLKSKADKVFTLRMRLVNILSAIE